MNCYLIVIFWIVALGFSIFYGWYGVTIHLTVPDKNHNSSDKDGISLLGQRNTWCSPKQSPPPHWTWWFHQFWLNFFASAIGWTATFYLLFYRLPSLKCGKGEFGIADGFFVLLALLGVTGLLPWRLFNTSLK